MSGAGKVFITGGAGFIGCHMAELCLEKGHEVVCYDDLSVGVKKNVPDGARFVKGDIMDIEPMTKAMSGSEFVFHLAAKVSMRLAVDEFIDDGKVNIIGTLNTMQAARNAGSRRFVYASSMAVYGNSEFSMQDEKHPTYPTSPYGVSKLSSEHYVRQLGELWNFETNICRYFNTFGTKQTPSPYVGVITIFCRKFAERKAPEIFGDGKRLRDFIHVSDIANGSYLAAVSDVHGETFNLGTGIGTSINDVSKLLIERIKPEILPTHGPPRPGEPENSVADIGKARKMLGFEPKWKLEDKIDEVITSNLNKEG